MLPRIFQIEILPVYFPKTILLCYHVISRVNIILIPCTFQREYYPISLYFPERLLPSYRTFSSENITLIAKLLKFL